VVGGSLTGALALLGGLDRRRFTPSLVLAERKPGLQLDATPLRLVDMSVVSSLPSRPGASRPVRALIAVAGTAPLALRVVRIGRLLRTERPELVYLANGVGPHLATVLAAARAGIPIVCHLKGFRQVRRLDRWASRRVAVAVGMTATLVDFYQARGLRPQHFDVVPDGIDVAGFATGGGQALRARLGIASDVPVVGIVGHIQPWKGQALVLDAVARARRTVPALACLVVGGVHRDGATYGAELQRRASAPDLAGHAHFLGAREDVGACMDAMDVVLHASVTPEPFGRVVLEAMAAGRPVIAPAEGGPREIVDDGETGLLVPPRDADALATAIVTLVIDPARCAVMGAAARRRAANVFGLEQQVRAMSAIFERVLAERRTA
jgi:glycosyltransferase involved in cell wall biosynthesis